MSVPVINRKGWNARPPRAVTRRTSPAEKLLVHHTAGPSGLGMTRSQEARAVRAIQNFHMDTRGWSDIAYPRLLFPSGRTYVGRRPDRIGAHSPGHNVSSQGYALYGNYEHEQPTAAAKRAIAELHRLDVNRGHTRANASIQGHRDVRATACPGRHLYAALPEIRRMATRREVTRYRIQARRRQADGTWNSWFLTGPLTLRQVGNRVRNRPNLRRRIRANTGPGRVARVVPVKVYV